MYKNGVGVKKDLNEAIGWFIIASDNGHMLAKYALGLSYYHGNGLIKNYQKAMNLFLDASYKGHPASQINVGNMYYYGQSVGKNYPKAHMWWSIAKEKGVEAAFNNLEMIETKQTIFVQDLKQYYHNTLVFGKDIRDMNWAYYLQHNKSYDIEQHLTSAHHHYNRLYYNNKNTNP